MVVMKNYDDFVCTDKDGEGCTCKRCELTLKIYEDNTPWAKLYNQEALAAHKKDLPFPDNKNNNIRYSTEEWDEFSYDWEHDLRPISKILEENTVYETGKKPRPNLMVLNDNFHTWCFWQVTGGRFIADSHKKVWVLWNHHKRPITQKNIGCLKHNKRDNYMWHKLPDSEETLNIFYEIKDAAQELAYAYLKWVNRYNMDNGYTNNTKMQYVQWDNCNNMPSIKAFRSDQKKDFDHSRFKWKTGRRSAGGNQGWLEPEEPRKFPDIPYVHKMMQDYNKWLKRGRKYKPPKQGSIDKFLT